MAIEETFGRWVADGDWPERKVARKLGPALRKRVRHLEELQVDAGWTPGSAEWFASAPRESVACTT